MRLEGSDDPRRIFTASTRVAGKAGLIGVRRVLDSAPLFDAVATQDTVTLIRSAIRGLLRTVDPRSGSELRAVLSGEDDYAGPGKPACDWDDAHARAAVVDRLARDGLALLAVLEGRQLTAKVSDAAELVALVIGQDLEQDGDGTFGIVRKVARDRIISTVDRDARRGHKTAARKFDGYKGHIAVDPDSEIITDTAVGPANGGDGEMTGPLTTDLDAVEDADHDDLDDGGGPAIYGDAAYGSGDNLADLERRGVRPMVNVQPPATRGGKFTKGNFDIDLDADTVTCPAAVTVPIRRRDDGSGIATFGSRCGGCPMRERCTSSAGGRSVNIHRHEQLLAQARTTQRDPAWRDDYRATRPKVERKLAHAVRRGRKARRRGLQRVDADWNLLGGALNFARVAVLGVRNIGGTWRIAT